jgi:hypothetical protein
MNTSDAGPWTPPEAATPSPPPRKRHRIRTTLIVTGSILGGFLVLGGILTAVAGPSPQPATSPAPQASTAAPAAAPAPPPSSAPVLQVTRVHFTVTGTGSPSITYGSDADSRTPPGSFGPLGDGVALPFHASMRFRGDASYYSMDAQLEGGGDIHCKITVSGPDIDTMTVSSGHASGGYNICSVQAAPNDANGSSWQNEG